MSWELIWTGPALKDMRRLDRRIARRVRDALVRLAETGQGDVARLRAGEPEWRPRIWDWRVRFTYDYSDQKIFILRVLPRGRAYQD
jgi:mRNA-degrading endonuclease RelE of RelBE toxin-antitoxin system